MFRLKEDEKGFVRLDISGRIDADEMREVLDSFLAIVEAREKTDFLYTITDFEFPALAAIGVEFGYMPRLFATLRKIGKVAVLSDADWLRRVADAEGKLIPGLTIESFKLTQEEQAVDWLLADS